MDTTSDYLAFDVRLLQPDSSLMPGTYFGSEWKRGDRMSQASRSGDLRAATSTSTVPGGGLILTNAIGRVADDGAQRQCRAKNNERAIV
jgi:hypothetical protein